MAKLYGRIPRFSHTELISLFGIFVALACSHVIAKNVRADSGILTSGAPSASEISEWAQGLSESDAARREQAYRRLTTLELDALPSIAQRLDELSRSRPHPDKAIQALTAIRHAVGSRRADDAIDIAPGVMTLLERSRDRDTLRIVEPLLLLRSLERIGTREAGLEVVRFIALDRGAWSQELRCARSRMGMGLLPVLIEMRGHENAAVRRWAARGIRALGMQDPYVAVALADQHLVAEILKAYSKPLDFKALPVIVSSINSDQIEIRDVAREAIRRFGKNAIWQLRVAYEEATGDPADSVWDWQRVLKELSWFYDRKRIEEADSAFAKGLAAYRRSDFETMVSSFDWILASFPDFEKRSEMAPGYAAFGHNRLKADDLEKAQSAYRRALRLSPNSPAVTDWRAQIAFITAEQQLSRGIADIEGYEKALQHNPDHEAARMVIDRISGAWGMRREVARRWSKVGAVVLLTLFALGQLYRRRRRESHNV
ncbi:MAG: hypothetical protein JXA30_13470 [Deltaproteobacteria bacterium]|nr:hypothetical protein [Deltaproteobacteria bacterium]